MTAAPHSHVMGATRMLLQRIPREQRERMVSAPVVVNVVAPTGDVVPPEWMAHIDLLRAELHQAVAQLQAVTRAAELERLGNRGQDDRITAHHRWLEQHDRALGLTRGRASRRAE